MSTKTAIQWTDVTDNIIVVEGGAGFVTKDKVDEARKLITA